MKTRTAIILCFILTLAAYGVDLTVGSNVGAAGSSQNVVTISLANDVSVRGIQLDLIDDPDLLVPDSVVATERTRTFTIVPQENDGVLTILLMSLQGAIIEPDSGEIFKIYYTISPNAQHGQELDLIAENSVIVHKEDGTTVYLPVKINNGKFYIQNSTDVEKNQTAVIEEYALAQNYPNPFNPKTNIEFSLPNTAPVMLGIYNTLGQKISTVVDNVFPSGHHKVVWNGYMDSGKEAPAGVYYYQMVTPDCKRTKKLILVR